MIDERRLSIVSDHHNYRSFDEPPFDVLVDHAESSKWQRTVMLPKLALVTFHQSSSEPSFSNVSMIEVKLLNNIATILMPRYKRTIIDVSSHGIYSLHSDLVGLNLLDVISCDGDELLTYVDIVENTNGGYARYYDVTLLDATLSAAKSAMVKFFGI